MLYFKYNFYIWPPLRSPIMILWSWCISYSSWKWRKHPPAKTSWMILPQMLYWRGQGLSSFFLFFFFPQSHSLFCGRDQTYILVWICKPWKKCMAIPLKTYSNHYWERTMGKAGHAKIIVIIFQSLEVKQSFRRVRKETFHHEQILLWFYFLLQDLIQPQARQGTERAAEKPSGSRRDIPTYSRTFAFFWNATFQAQIRNFCSILCKYQVLYRGTQALIPMLTSTVADAPTQS